MENKVNVVYGLTLDEERALYNLTDAVVENCEFKGPADGESALKEARRISVKDCNFYLRYPLWHTEGFLLDNCYMSETCRAALWYSFDGEIKNCRLDGIKVLRECGNIKLNDVTANSPELGWKCRDLTLSDCDITSEYFLLECKNTKIDNLRMKGKYSFQYTEDLEVSDSVLDTKDAFWHCKNVTVRDSVIKGEYLAWYSDGLTLINCKIIGTQPLCYCKNLKLVNCTTEGTDLMFEYSDVDATVQGRIDSVKNPHAGRIVADEIGEIILENSVLENNCEIIVRRS